MKQQAAANIMQLLNPDNTMSFNRLLSHAIGATETIIYFSLISKMTYYESRGKLDEQGFFYATALDIQESTTFTQRQQAPVIKKLVDIGLIETKLKGVPAKKHYHVICNTELILNLLEQGKNIAASIKQQALHEKVTEKQESSQFEQNVETSLNKAANSSESLKNSQFEQNVKTSLYKMSKQA